MADRGMARGFFDSALASDVEVCIPWPFAVGSGGYGDIRVDGRTMRVHRFMCEQAHGPAPKGKEAAHRCGVRLCINPRHLRWLTRSENQLERAEHGTSNRGTRQWMSLLDEEKVRRIRHLYATESQHALADRFGVGRKTIADVVNRKTWAWVD